MSEKKTTSTIAISGLIGTLAGVVATLIGVFATDFLSRGAEFERSQTQQAILAYNLSLDEIFGDQNKLKDNPFLLLALYADDEVLSKMVELKRAAGKFGNSLEDENLRKAAIKTIQAMREHVTGDPFFEKDVYNEIDMLIFQSDTENDTATE